MAAYPEGFLDTLISINFPSGGYITVLVAAMNEVVGTTPPPCPIVNLVLPTTAKLIDLRETCIKATTPAKTTFTRFRFIWPSGLALPTVANYGTSVGGVLGDITYAQEFSRWIHIQGLGGTFITGPPYSTSGYYPDAGSADAAAAAWNTSYGASHAPLGYLYLALTGGEAGPIFLGTMASAFVDVPVVSPASSRASLTRQYLVKTPRELVEATLSIFSTLGKAGSVTVKGYVGTTPKTLSKVNPNGYTSIDGTNLDPSGVSAFNITAELVRAGLNQVAIFA